MNKLAFKVINPLVRLILSSPLHGLMSHNTVLLQFTGRKSGKRYVMPVSYHHCGSCLHCFTSRANQWWRNLAGGDAVTLTLHGKTITGTPTVHTTASDATRNALRDFLIASPRDASYSQVSLDPDGQPNAEDVRAACERLVLIAIEKGESA